jgi:hypothetical protein
MKQKYHLAFFLVSLAWLAFTMCPPWAITYGDGQWISQHSQFCGYGFIFAPPDVSLKTGAEMHIDFVRLSLKYLASLVLIAAVTLRINKPLVVSRRPSQFKLRLAVMSIICLVVSALLLRHEAVSQLKVALVPRTPCVLVFLPR